jgi:hypothetical protein
LKSLQVFANDSVFDALIELGGVNRREAALTANRTARKQEEERRNKRRGA